MRILFVGNQSTERCGVRTFGDEFVAAVRRAGHTVVVWDGTYSSVVKLGYLPPRLLSQYYDLVHLNWDPQAINHYLPEHFVGHPPLSLFLHDVPPHSTCPVADVARWKFGFEPADGVQVVPEGIPPSPPGLVAADDQMFDPDIPIRIGVTGIRSDPGMAMVREVCAARGWVFCPPLWWDGGPWLSTEDEIRRLAACHVNVCWYHTSGRGKSMAAAFCCAARRPLVLSGSSMFSALWPYDDEIVIASATHDNRGQTTAAYSRHGLERAIAYALESGSMATRACADLAWDRVIQPVVAAWEEGLGR